jgi:uncharacterized protein (TIGR00369 family)
MTTETLKGFLEQIPFNSLLGLRLARVHKDGVTVECALRPELMNGSGVLHGGVAATMADVAVGMSLSRHLGKLRAITTVEMKINYLRPVTHGRIAARCRLVRVGARICCGRVEVRDAQKRPVAEALVTFMILDQPAKPS